jgi:ATP adenylyltransferase
MKQLWAPWRIEFIKQPKPNECILCIKPREHRDRNNFILYRGRYCFVMMNIYPYNNGHLLISPYQHTSTLESVENNVLLDMMGVLKQSLAAIKQALSPEGINIGLNLGKVAGAGIEDHLHFHVVPRWLGDTSFMAVAADVRVIPEHLKATYDKLRSFFPKEDHRLKSSPGSALKKKRGGK